MVKKENLDKTSAWPFVEAKKMLRERKSLIEKKGKITLQTGYGPSGLPHIGTFGEVARTSCNLGKVVFISFCDAIFFNTFVLILKKSGHFFCSNNNTSSLS